MYIYSIVMYMIRTLQAAHQHRGLEALNCHVKSALNSTFRI